MSFDVAMLKWLVRALKAKRNLHLPLWLLEPIFSLCCQKHIRILCNRELLFLLVSICDSGCDVVEIFATTILMLQERNKDFLNYLFPGKIMQDVEVQQLLKSPPVICGVYGHGAW